MSMLSDKPASAARRRMRSTSIPLADAAGVVLWKSWRVSLDFVVDRLSVPNARGLVVVVLAATVVVVA
eukprot:4380716-Amphidinium_carterae.1